MKRSFFLIIVGLLAACSLSAQVMPEQKSRLMFIKPENKTKTQFRYRLRKRGYIVDTERRQAFYTKDTDRSPTMEKNAAIKHHFIVLPMKEVKGVKSEE